MIYKDFNDGVQAAAARLVQTAQDFEQRLPARQAQNELNRAKGRLGWQKEADDIRMAKEKAQLLRGQASIFLSEMLLKA